MEKTRESIPFVQCRLCSAFGHHKIDIFGGNAFLGYANPNALADKILRCIDVRVERDDETTRICGKCVRKLNKFARFRDMCAAINAKMRKSKQLRHGNSFRGNVTQNRSPSGNSPIFNISLTDEEINSEYEEINAVPATASGMPMMSADGQSSTGEREAATKATKTNQSFVENRKKQRPETAIKVSKGTKALCLEHEWLHLDADGEVGKDETEQSVSDQIFAEDHPQFDTLNRTNFSMGEPQRRSDTDEPSSNDETYGSIALTVPICKASYSVETRKKVNHKTAKQCSLPLIKCRSRGKCNELYESRDAMMYHMATYHAKGIKRKFSCYLCKNSFSCRGNLQQHMDAVHSGLRRFKCPFPKCSTAFAHKCNLQKHTNAIHTKKVAFKCTECPAKFYHKQLLTRHLANKHGKGITFSCYICTKSLCSKQSLNKHINMAHMSRTRPSHDSPLLSGRGPLF